MTVMCSPSKGSYTFSRHFLNFPAWESACTGNLRQAARLIGVESFIQGQIVGKELTGYDIGYRCKQFSNACLHVLRTIIATPSVACLTSKFCCQCGQFELNGCGS